VISALSRRSFLKLSGSAVAAGALGLGVYSPQTRAASISLAQLLTVDPLTLEYKIFSPCCYFCPDYLVVSHYQPVVLCEVIKGGGDTAVGGGLSIGSPLSAGVDSNDYTTTHVRLWQIPDWAVNVAMAGQGCKMCGVNKAKSASFRSITSVGSCGGLANPAIAQAVSGLNSAIPSCFPRLLYTTEVDPTWNTGCRDWGMIPPTELECSALGSAVSSMFGLERCIGSNWGPLYPRQMATQNDSPVINAGIAAYRALHVARNAIGSLPFDTTIAVGKLQQTTPHLTVGLRAGSLGLDTQMRLGNVSIDHTYTFVWWVPVVCCKKYEEIFGFCAPQIPC